MTTLPSQATGRLTYLTVTGRGLRWGILSSLIVGISSITEDGLPPALRLPADYRAQDDGQQEERPRVLLLLVGPQLRSVTITARIELVEAERIKLVPLPRICRTEAQEDLHVTQVALAGDSVAFFVVEPAV